MFVCGKKYNYNIIGKYVQHFNVARDTVCAGQRKAYRTDCMRHDRKKH